MTKKEKRLNQIMFNLKILKNDFENFKEWDTKDEENWESMIRMVEIVEEQINQIA